MPGSLRVMVLAAVTHQVTAQLGQLVERALPAKLRALAPPQTIAAEVALVWGPAIEAKLGRATAPAPGPLEVRVVSMPRYIPRVEGLPDRDWLIAELVRLRDAAHASRDERVRFIGQEFRVALYALVAASDAIARKDQLAGLQHLRLLAETALRVRWIGGDEDLGDAAGQLVVDPAVVRVRAESVRKRDLLNLGDAYKAIHEVGGDPFPLLPEIRGLADRIDVAPAPTTIRGMATSRSAKAIYAGHRLCSSMVHAGHGLTRLHLLPLATMGSMVDEAAMLCTAWGDAILRSVQPVIRE